MKQQLYKIYKTLILKKATINIEKSWYKRNKNNNNKVLIIMIKKVKTKIKAYKILK